MATHSSILAWEIPWTEKCGRLQSMGSQRVGHDLETTQPLTRVSTDHAESLNFHLTQMTLPLSLSHQSGIRKGQIGCQDLPPSSSNKSHHPYTFQWEPSCGGHLGSSNIYLSLPKPASQWGISGKLSEEPELLFSPNNHWLSFSTSSVNEGPPGNLHFCPHLRVTRWYPRPHTNTVSEKAF